MRFVALLLALMSVSYHCTDALAGGLWLASSQRIGKTQIRERRTLEAIRLIAEEAHVVIGVSGEMTGPNSALISIDSPPSTLGTLLDAVCRRDRCFRWQADADGSIQVFVGKRPLNLGDIVIPHLEVKNATSADLFTLIIGLPAVDRWARRTDATWST